MVRWGPGGGGGVCLEAFVERAEQRQGIGHLGLDVRERRVLALGQQLVGLGAQLRDVGLDLLGEAGGALLLLRLHLVRVRVEGER